jgi:hypothetical protein
VFVDSERPDKVRERLGLRHLGPRAQPPQSIPVKVNGAGNVSAGIVLGGTRIYDTHRRIGSATGEPIDLGQELRVRVTALMDGDGHAWLR